MRREQYLRYYRETESKADILVDQSEDKFKVKMIRIIIEEKIGFNSRKLVIV